MPTEAFRIEDDLRQVCPEQWARLSHGAPGFRIEVYRALAEKSDAPGRFKAFLVEDGKELRAAAVCEEVTSVHQPSPLDSVMFGRARGFCEAVGIRTRPLLSFFVPLGAGSSIGAQPAEENERQQWLIALMDGIERYAAERGAGIGFGDTSRESLTHRLLSSRGYLCSEARPTAYMPIEWNDFSGYVARLKRVSANAAHTVKTERRRARKLGVTIRRIPFDEATGRTLYEFARRHYRHKNGVDPAYAADFFQQLGKMVGDDFIVFEARRNGERTGMLGVLRAADTAWVAWVGFDATERDNDFTYFNLTFYGPAEYAASAGIRTLLYGNAVYDAKIRRGCRLHRGLFFYRPHSRLMRAVIRPCLRAHRAWYRRKYR